MNAVDNGIYDRVADTWWDADGFMALLRTAVNPPRVAYFDDVLARHMGGPREGHRLLDVGCGGGLLSEAFAARGLEVTGIDASPHSLTAARVHAAGNGLSIDYRDGRAEALPFDDASFDVVACCDMLEHVDDIDAVLAEIARVLKPGGVFLFDTINRTWLSNLVAIKLAQDWWPTRMIPRDVHVHAQFVRPAELDAALRRQHLTSRDMVGLSPAFRPLRTGAAWLRHKLGRMDFATFGEYVRLQRSTDLRISYMGYATKPQRGLQPTA